MTQVATPASPPLLSRLLGALRDQRLLIFDTLLLGLIGAAAGQVFSWMVGFVQHLLLFDIAGYSAPGLPSEHGQLQQTIGVHGLWLIPVITTLGGLASGLLVYTFAPEAEGHGTDTAVKAFHRATGLIRPRVPVLKLIASAITIGSGGSAGREGPTALICAGFGSAYATYTHRSDNERRLLILIGMAAGLAAVFRSPIGTAIFAIEVLYGGVEFEANALLYTMVGSIVAYAVAGRFSGYRPLFDLAANVATPIGWNNIWYVVLGVVCGAVATVVPVVFYRTRDLFNAIPLPPHVKPAIGGLGVGLIALALPQVLSGGYGWVELGINGQLSLHILLLLTGAKLIAFALTVGSGGSGGVFAPTLFVGAMLGGAMARLLHQPPGTFSVIAMAALFGASARVPFATLLMVTEMTQGYRLLVPAALAVFLASWLQSIFSARLKYQSLYEAQVHDRGQSPAHQLELITAVLDLLAQGHLSLPAAVTHVNLRSLLASGIPVDLPDQKQMTLQDVGENHPCLGKTPAECFSPLRDGAEVVAVFRQGHTLLPTPQIRLRKNDRLLLIAPRDPQPGASAPSPASPAQPSASQ